MKNAAQSLCVPLLFLALAGALDANSSNLRELSAIRGFEANDGQLEDERTQYFARLQGYIVTLDSQGASLYPSGNGARTRLQLEGVNLGAELAGEELLPGRVSYFVGRNQANWRSDIPTFARVRAKSVYRGVDVVYYRNGDSQLEHDFVIAPGGNVGDIRVGISGADRVRVKNGEISVETASGEFRLKRPAAFQEIDGRRHRIPVEYVLAGHRLRFRVGKYDHRRELVIDPVLVFSRFIGGSNEDDATDVVTDSSGNVYVVGVTQSANLAVLNPLPNYNTLHGSRNLFISKLNSGGVVLFTTYLGGGAEAGAKAAVDSAGNLYLVGASSGGYPTTLGAYKTTAQSNDFFVTKLAASGASLLYSTFVGGTSDESGYFGGVLGTPAVAVDPDGNAYVCGRTNSSDFPVVNGNPRPGNAAVVGGLYAFELNAAGSALQWSTYIANEGIPVGVALDGSRNLLFAGTALDNSSLAATPMTATAGAFQTSKQGFDDGYVGKLSPTGSLLYLTFLGGAGADDPIAITADTAGNAYVTGQVGSLNFPTASAYQSSCHGALICVDTFVTKLNSAGSGLVFSTYLGGTAVGSGSLASGADRGQAIAVDPSGNVWVA